MMISSFLKCLWHLINLQLRIVAASKREKRKLGTWKLFKYKQMTTERNQERYDLKIVNESDRGLK